MEWTVARATQHTTPAGEAEGRHPRRDCAGRRGHHWESGEGKRRFCGLVIFHRHECAKKQLVPCAHIKHVSLVR